MFSSPSSSEKESNSQPTISKPKKFLKKGEGLKRFAAYNPPLPTTARKAGRRKTFVKFKLDEFHPELFANDSINLSTEIPKIAPPKIIHTPVKTRPPQHLTESSEYNDYNDEQESDEDHDQTPDADSVRESIPVTETNYDEPTDGVDEEDELEEQPEPVSKIPVKTEKESRRYNLRGGKKKDDNLDSEKQVTPKILKKTRRKVVVELFQSRPKDMNTIARHIQIIQSTVNELKESILREQPADQIQQVACSATVVKRPKKGSRAKKSIVKEPEEPVPPENTGSINRELIITLTNEIENLKASFDEINTKK